MTTLKLKISEHSLDELVNYLIGELKFDYENHSTDMSVLMSEDFYFINTSYQLNMIILHKKASFILLDIIGGGGGSGLLSIDWGSEKSYTRMVAKIINRYAEENALTVESI